MDSVLDFLGEPLSLLCDLSAGSFLDLDGVDPEPVVGVVSGEDPFCLCREGQGVGAWFKIGSIPVLHVSHVRRRK